MTRSYYAAPGWAVTKSRPLPADCTEVWHVAGKDGAETRANRLVCLPVSMDREDALQLVADLADNAARRFGVGLLKAVDQSGKELACKVVLPALAAAGKPESMKKKGPRSRRVRARKRWAGRGEGNSPAGRRSGPGSAT